MGPPGAAARPGGRPGRRPAAGAALALALAAAPARGPPGQAPAEQPSPALCRAAQGRGAPALVGRRPPRLGGGRPRQRRARRCLPAGAEAPPLLEAPLRRLPLPERFVGGDYFLVGLSVRGAPLTMLLDSGLSAATMLTPAAVERLGPAVVPGDPARASKTYGTMGSVQMQEFRLEGAEVSAGGGGAALPLGPVGGVVQDFPQRKIGEEVGITIDGMLGQGFLRDFDAEADGERLRLWGPGELPEEQLGWRRLVALGLPGNLHGLLLSVPGCAEPVVGVVDTGASHTVINQKAAEVLGLAARAADGLRDGPGVNGFGVDGSQLWMPTVSVSNASLCGASRVTIELGTGVRRCWSFGNCVERGELSGNLDSIKLAVGDIAFFESLLSQTEDSIGAFVGPAALLGQDLLAQRPLRYSARRGRLWLRGR